MRQTVLRTQARKFRTRYPNAFAKSSFVSVSKRARDFHRLTNASHAFPSAPPKRDDAQSDLYFAALAHKDLPAKSVSNEQIFIQVRAIFFRVSRQIVAKIVGEFARKASHLPGQDLPQANSITLIKCLLKR